MVNSQFELTMGPVLPMLKAHGQNPPVGGLSVATRS